MPAQTNVAPVVIVGGSGNVGVPLVAQCALLQHPVYPIVRDAAKSAKSFTKLGTVKPVEVKDWKNVAELEKAISALPLAENSAVLVLIKPFFAEVVDFTKNYLEVAKKTGKFSFIVHVSTVGAEINSQLTFLRSQALVEAEIEKAGIPYCHLRCNYFHSNLLHYVPSIKKDGKFQAAWGNGKLAGMAAEDVADAISAILKDPKKHISNTYQVTGPAAVDGNEIAKVFSEVMGKPVTFAAATPDVIRKNLASQLKGAALEYFMDLQVMISNGKLAAASDDLKKLTGKSGSTPREWALKHKSSFA